MNKSELPFITISMPVRNEGKYIAVTIMELLKQDYPDDRFEIIVADGMSDDNTKEIIMRIASENPQVIYTHNKKRLSSSGRNIGFKQGRGDLFLVVDGHCAIRNNNMLKNLVACFEKSKAECLGRPQPFLMPKELTTQRAIAMARKSKIGHSNNSYIHTQQEGYVSPISVGCAYKKEVFEKIGYVDESFDACEDVEFNHRIEKAGLKAYLCPKIAIYYYARDSYISLFKQQARYGRGRARYIRKHPEGFTIETVAPGVIVLYFTTIPFISLYFSNHLMMIIAYASFAILYLIILTTIGIAEAKNNLKLGMQIALALLVTHIAFGWGFLRTVFLPKTMLNQSKAR
ncbi:MAG TPA: glycosyltransferase family 2 protein [Nitrospirae bacterium]|nr:glycosyltransferase family 2 protein [Nitrospirota bacterium]